MPIPAILLVLVKLHSKMPSQIAGMGIIFDIHSLTPAVLLDSFLQLNGSYKLTYDRMIIINQTVRFESPILKILEMAILKMSFFDNDKSENSMFDYVKKELPILKPSLLLMSSLKMPIFCK